MKIISFIVFCFIFTCAFSQSPTVGLIYSSGLEQEGYTLFAPEQNNDVFLINNCGEVVNHWVCNDLPGNTSYLLTNGNLLYAGKDQLELRDWDDNLLWEYETTSNGINQHHDIEPLPNGNVLCVVTEQKTSAELIDFGRDPNTAGSNFKIDKIIELEPVGANGANIVWEWHFWDHLIQEFDNTKQNFGVVANNPDLLDLNYITISNNDWTHINGIDYNESLDQIIISSRTISEIYIIDHSTTTAEAATKSGGNSGKGGNFLWRWGNPYAYHQGSIVDQKLYGQHDCKWVEEGYLHNGKISVFNNSIGGSNSNSGVHLITPPLSGYNYTITANLFEPSDFFYSWSGSAMGIPVYSNIKGGANSLPNGGFIICETTTGRFTEIDDAGNVVWVYKNPSDVSIYNQFDVIPITSNQSFRAMKYPTDYSGIVGNDVTPIGIIEDINSISESCKSNVSISEIALNEIAIINPIVNREIIFINANNEIENLELFDLSGRFIQSWISNSSSLQLSPRIVKGVYIFKYELNGQIHQQRILIQ